MAKKPKSEVKPLCPVKYSLMPDGYFKTATVEAIRLHVTRNSGETVGSIAVSLRCVCDSGTTGEEFEYTKSIAQMVSRAIRSLAENATKPAKVTPIVTKRKGK